MMHRLMEVNRTSSNTFYKPSSIKNSGSKDKLTGHRVKSVSKRGNRSKYLDKDEKHKEQNFYELSQKMDHFICRFYNML